MKTITRKAAALILAAILLVGIIPSAMADSNPFAQTHWAATGINCKFINEDKLSNGWKTFFEFMDFAVQFVPSEDWLSMLSVSSIYCGVDFSRNGTFQLSLKVSIFGEVVDDLSFSTSGTWSYSCGKLLMNIGKLPVQLHYSGNVLSFSVIGIGMDFARS